MALHIYFFWFVHFQFLNKYAKERLLKLSFYNDYHFVEERESEYIFYHFTEFNESQYFLL